MIGFLAVLERYSESVLYRSGGQAAKLERYFGGAHVDRGKRGSYIHGTACTDTGRIAGGEGNDGSALSHRTVRTATERDAVAAAASDFGHCGGAWEAARCGKRVERTAVEHAVSRRGLDGAAGGASRSRQPHERVRAIPAGTDGTGANHQALRRSALGGVGGCQVRAHRCVSGAAGFVARTLGAAAAFAEDGGFRANVSPPGPRSAHGGLDAVPVCMARAAPHRARDRTAQAKGLVVFV